MRTQRPRVIQSGPDRVGEQLGLAQRVADSLRGDRV